VAALSVAIALVVARWLDIRLEAAPASLFLCAVMFSAWFGGVRGGLLAAVLCMLAFMYYFVAPTHSLIVAPREIPRLVIFALSTVFVGTLSVAQRRATESLRHARNDLQGVVQELKKTNEALRESESRFRMMADTAPIMIWTSGTDMLRDFCNKPWREFTGRPAESELGSDWIQGVHPDDLKECVEIHTSSFDARQPFTLEYRLRHTDGEYRWVIEKGVPRYTPQGEFAGYIGSCLDITERKQAEAELQRSEAFLAEGQRISHTGSWDWHSATGKLVWSEEHYRIFGFEPHAVEPTPELLLGKVHEQDRPIVQRMLEDAMRGISDFNCEYRIALPDGSIKYIQGVGRPVTKLSGQVDALIGTTMDVTERKQAEAEREARQAAETANRAKNTFLANMSHELRTPLNGILGYAQILRRDTTLDVRQIDGLNVIQQSGKQLLTLINDILDFAKIEAGKLDLNLTDIALNKFVHTVAEIVGVRAAQKGLDFICDIAPDLPSGIRADENRLRQVLLNLLTNAIKFTDRGRVSLRVRFAPPARLRFEVQDTGIGVSADHLDTIFEPFEQVSDPQRRLGGAGLGLAISRQFVRRMGGDIYVTSQVNAGSTFWFELNVEVIEIAMLAPPERIVTGYEGPRKSVLVVDDVAANRAMAVDMLSQLGFEVVVAVNGPEALHKAQATRPDWILTDIVMPEMDGLEATRRLRQIPDFRHVPIIAMSASASGSDERKCLAAGVDAFVAKPIDMDQLLTQIATLLQLKWTYGPPSAPVAHADGAGPVVVPPPQELETLHQLARMGNMRDITLWAERVAELDQRYRPFADQLRAMAKGYQSKAIVTLVERHLETRPER
jgi:PAS domain S-box-containing protein